MRYFQDLFLDEMLRLPPKREINFHIELVPIATPVSKAPYQMMVPNVMELKIQLHKLLIKGYIRPSISRWCARIIFVKKKDGTFRLCIDYHYLNKLITKNKYPLAHINHLFYQVKGLVVFSKINFRSRNHKLRIIEEDIPKTTFRTLDGHYEFTVLPFGLMNTLATFMCLKNSVFGRFLDKFVLIFIDEILVYSKELEEHKQHLEIVYQPCDKINYMQNSVNVIFLG